MLVHFKLIRCYSSHIEVVKGTLMGPLLVLVYPCFRENVVTCKIVFFLCSLDYILLKNFIVFLLGNQISKWRSFKEKAIFDLLFTFFSHQGKDTKNPPAHISLTYTYFGRPIDFFALRILQKLRIYHVWFLFGVTPGVDSFRTILEQSVNKMVRES